MSEWGVAGWRKSSYSAGGNSDACVEIACRPELVGVRDSKNTTGPRLIFGAEHWHAFLRGLLA